MVVTQMITTTFDTTDNAETNYNDDLPNAIGVLGEWRQFSPTGAYRGKTPVVGDSWDGVEFKSPVAEAAPAA